MDAVINLSNRLISNVNQSFQRGLMDKIDWSQRLVEVRGSRGVGKTTLLLQKAHELKMTGAKVVYASLDLPYFFSQHLFDFVDEFTKYGGTHLFLDEVHRYPSKNKDSDWSLELKNIYDSFPALKIVYSGSSILHLFKGKGDLSRRKATYLMNGLSFREYLALNSIGEFAILTLEDLLQNHEEIAMDITDKIRPLQHFKAYLKHGFYPFYSGNESVYCRQLQDVVNLIIDADLPYTATISQNAREQLKRLLGAISSSVPYVSNMSKLATLVNVTDHRTLLKYMQLLEEAQLIALLRSDAKGNKQLQKPDKIFLNNTNLKHALSISETNVGSERETFFYNQLTQHEKVTYPQKGDFKVNEKYIFEIGGKNKTQKQIQDLANAYVVSDEIEIGFGKKIPLWLFGMMY